MEMIEKLKWRYATKEFDAAKKLSNTQVNQLMQATNMAPSSFGLQPFRMLLVEDDELRQKLKKVAWGQPQVTDASSLIVFAAYTNVTSEDIDDFMKRIADIRQVSLESLESYEAMLKGSLLGKSQADLAQWTARQAYIALGTLLTVCAVEEIDACPMEGFEKDKFDEILGLSEQGLASVVMVALGYRSEKDKYQHLAKVRKDLSNVVLKY
jgi:nitroreductase